MFTQRNLLESLSGLDHDTRRDFFILFRYIRSKNRENLKYRLAPNNLADMTEEEVDLHRGLLHEKKKKSKKAKAKKSKSETLAFNQSAIHTDLVPNQLDWRDYGTETDILDQFNFMRTFF